MSLGVRLCVCVSVIGKACGRRRIEPTWVKEVVLLSENGCRWDVPSQSGIQDARLRSLGCTRDWRMAARPFWAPRYHTPSIFHLSLLWYFWSRPAFYIMHRCWLNSIFRQQGRKILVFV